MTDSSRFRFYGAQPPDWSEGEDDGHLFSIQFERQPTDDELEGMARLYEEDLDTGPASPAAAAWQWSERFAAFYVQERSYGSASFVGAVRSFLIQAHELVPLVDAVFYGAHGGSGAGTPDAGPDLGRAANPRFQRPVDTSLPPLAPNAVFEESRAQAQVALVEVDINAEISRWNEKRKAGEVGIERSTLQPVTDPDDDEPSSWSEEIRAAFQIPDPPSAPGDHIIHCPERPLAALSVAEDRYTTLAYLDAAQKRREVRFPEKIYWLQPRATLHPSGERCLLYADEKLYEADLRTGKARLIYEVTGVPAHAAAYVSDGRVTIGTPKGIRLYDLSGAVPRQIHSVAGATGALHVAADGEVLIAEGRLRVLAYGDGKLKRIGTVGSKHLSFAGEVAGRVLLQSPVSTLEHGCYYELTHLDEVLAKLATARKKTTRKRATSKSTPRKATKKATKLTLDKVKLASLPPAAKKVPRESNSRFPRKAVRVTCSAGRVAAMTMASNGVVGHGVQFIDDDDQVVDLTPLITGAKMSPKINSLSRIALSDCGTRLFFQSTSNHLYAIDLQAPDKRIQTVHRSKVATGNVMDLQPYGRDELFVLAFLQLRHLRRVGKGWRQVASVAVKRAYQLAVMCDVDGPTAVAVLNDNLKQRLQVFAVLKGSLKSIGKIADPVDAIEARGEHLLARLTRKRLEVTGVAEAVSHARSKA